MRGKAQRVPAWRNALAKLTGYWTINSPNF